MVAKKHASERYREIRNRKAQRDYFIDDTVECGIALTGTEVKSVRAGQVQIEDAFVRLEKGQPILYHCHIAEYSHGNLANHKPYRPRRLLMHKSEIRKWEREMQSGGKTLIPLRLYFKKALVKVQVGLCRGKKQFDKRDDLKKAVALREAQRMVKHHL